MRKNFPITQQETSYPDHYRMITTTTPKGVIKYSNQHFREIAGFSEEELHRQAHNIVRHPDMPQAAFESMWENIKQDRPWKGIVKNRCKNGNHYWVDAFVTPIGDDKTGQTEEIQSVRRKPEPDEVKRAETVYQKLNNNEAVRALKAPQIPLTYKMLMALGVAFIPAIVAEIGSFSMPASIGLVLSSLCLASILGYRCVSGFNTLVSLSEAVVNDRLAQYIYTGRMDEVGQIELALKMKSSEMAAVMGRVMDTSEGISERAEYAKQAGCAINDRLGNQQSETEQVATAMQEMSATIQEMAGNTSQVSEAALMAQNEAGNGEEKIDSAITAIRGLDQELEEAASSINELNDLSTQIGEVLEVIGSIAEQTNLLALNAAIEAARAGEHGRGFAVVADEVRNLARRTQESTTDIQETIHKIENGVQKTVALITRGREWSSECVERGIATQDAFSQIKQRVDDITDMATQVASAVEEQSAVSETISQNIQRINDLALETGEEGDRMRQSNEQLKTDLDDLLRLIRRLNGQQQQTVVA